ncbi:MAG TPA: exonuclease sbcCD subunit D, partial [Streptosporangiaceae bacterium]
VAGILPNALEVRIDPEFAAPVQSARADAADVTKTPGQLFADYCAAENVADTRVAALFAELHDEVTSAGTAG